MVSLLLFGFFHWKNIDL